VSNTARLLAEIPWTDIPERPLVLVPVGSTEQHGPHLPLHTDTVMAEAVATELTGELGGYVAPAVSTGASGEHQGFPGLLSIGTDTLRLVLVELVRSLAPWAGRVVLVNGHGGNFSGLTGAVAQLIDEGHHVTWVPCTVEGDAHAGHTETSLLLHLAPWLVRSHRAEPGNTRPISELLPDLEAHGVRAVSPNGVLGDPTGATAAQGAVLFAQMVQTARREL
jgi:mycofactocin system creatininase family protein